MVNVSTATAEAAISRQPGGERPAAPEHGEPRSDTASPARKRVPWPQRIRQHPYLFLAILCIAIGAIVALLMWWSYARQFETTDDAFVDARTVAYGAQVAGAITDVLVTDNQHVTTGQVLIRIDPRDYQAKLDQAVAQTRQASASIDNYTAQIEAQQARIAQADKQVSEAQAALRFSTQENSRYQDLLAKGAGTAQRAQQASSDLLQKQATFDAAVANANVTKRQIAVLRTLRENAQAQLSSAQAAVDEARANLDRTTIVAPGPGHIAKLSAGKGAYATPGMALLMFVPDEVWVTANFKETQLADMRVGQKVTMEIDAYPSREFHGHVDSIQAGSGTAFSLLPAENATGNYVKIVQRVPVKLVFDHPPDVLLGPGMSVVPSVKVR